MTIVISGYDGYLSSLLDEIKLIPKDEFINVSISRFPSSWNKIMSSIAKSKSTQVKYIHESLVSYGVSRINEIMAKTPLSNNCELLERASKFIEIPQSSCGEFLMCGEETGLTKKTVSISEATQRLCVFLADKLYVTYGEMIKSCIVISMYESIYVNNEFQWFVDKRKNFLSGDLKKSLVLKNEHLKCLIQSCSPYLVDVYIRYVYNVQNGIKVDVEKAEVLRKMMHQLKRTRLICSSVPDYRNIVLYNKEAKTEICTKVFDEIKLKEPKKEDNISHTIIGYTVEGYPCFIDLDKKTKFETPEGYIFDISMSSSKYIVDKQRP